MANFPIAYEFVKTKLKDSDPLEIARKSGAEYDQSGHTFRLLLMGRQYFVGYPSGEVYAEDQDEVKYTDVKTLILRYLINAGGMPPTGKNITYREVPGGQVYYKNFQGRCIFRLARTFGNNFEALARGMAKVPCEKVNFGDLSYRFQFINNVYITIILWQGDDELPPGANILFDGNAVDYFNAEDLAVAGDVLIDFLKLHGL